LIYNLLMPPPAFDNHSESIEAREFEQHLRDGIHALKNGDRSLAKRLLDQAALMNSADARVWVWLSGTTDDLEERRLYLERAVALEPSNTMAKRGLMLLTDQLDKTRLMSEGQSYASQAEPAPEEAVVKTYLCPNCGAKISFDVREINLVCQFCGFTRKIDESVTRESTDQVLDTVLPTTPAHRWAESQTRVQCEQCGVVVILPAGQTADSCPYCASNRFISSSILMELIDPQVIGLFKIDQGTAAKSIKTWLGKGLFSPDELAARHSGMQLHPAYYPFWIFEGTLEIPWFCDVNVGTGKSQVWEAHTGSQFEMFDNVLIPGLRKISNLDLAGIEPFDLNELVEFSPDYLAGWVALTYDLPLADASLKAREKVIQKIKSTLPSLVEPNHPKRNFSIGAGKWSGQTYKLALLPIFIGNYPFQGKRYRLLINGQTGKVSGEKPVDTLKMIMIIIAGIVLLAILMVILWSLFKLLSG
jgi:DNA-directed RNA polymerase subunit RPC12/RpoP